jgi:hypothetical protein
MKKRLDHGFGTPTSYSRAHDCEFEQSVGNENFRDDVSHVVEIQIRAHIA